jgi:mRNA interferase RelE/StbE
VGAGAQGAAGRLTAQRAWVVEIRPTALKSLKRLGRVDRHRLVDAIDGLPQGDTKRLVGGSGLWRLRVGDWRVIFERDDQARLVTVLAVHARGGAYKR